MEHKIKIELTPYKALAIICFLREYINEETENDPRFQSINESVEAYEKEVYNKLTKEQLDDALAENAVNKVIGKCPDN